MHYNYEYDIAKGHRMGLTKRLIEFENEDGFQKRHNIFVCKECLCDYALRDLANIPSSTNHCSYCKSVSHTVDFNNLMKRIITALLCFYGTAEDECVPPPCSDNYFGNVYSSHKLISEVLEDKISNDSRILEAIITSLQDNCWCKKDYYLLSKHVTLSNGWQEFCDAVKYQARYAFFNIKRPNSEIDEWDKIYPSEMLHALFSTISSLDLIRVVAPATTFWRARRDLNHLYNIALKDIGLPPKEFARASRMSAEGIPILYAASDKNTARKEIRKLANKTGVIAELQVNKPLRIIDFTQLPPIPSIFDKEKSSNISYIKFLHGFSKSISKRVSPNNKSHIEYVPTQIFTEYLRFIYAHKIDGICYKSSRCNGCCYALFIENKDLELKNIYSMTTI